MKLDSPAAWRFVGEEQMVKFLYSSRDADEMLSEESLSSAPLDGKRKRSGGHSSTSLR
eukprot:CAMPEP_0194294964 /NCGR_PEP_ID=MMETSP0169-20130528/52262_1 /TAXON_ID=218684 /ORGANISM="Corethron pennatum, Strain L29A3" /LENGTH=57 /DNA_ID=CAMNT_0039044015 /DNA_START=842 /DNA_END=1011 /DNA_ORIENTATION=+